MVNLASRSAWAGRTIAAITFAVALAVTGCSHNSSSTSTVPVAPSGAPVAATQPPPATTALQPAATLVAYKIAAGSAASTADANGLAPTPVTVPPGTESPAKYALRELANGQDSPLPPGTRLLSLKIDPDTKLATVNFSRQFRDNFQGGETHEAQAIVSVLETLGQFPDVQKVQFLVDGHKIDSLGGTQEIDEPLPTPQSGDNVASIKGA